jgi:hypothetical protein
MPGVVVFAMALPMTRLALKDIPVVSPRAAT